MYNVDLILSLDVIHHLIEEYVFEKYVKLLFNTFNKFVIIYYNSSDIYILPSSVEPFGIAVREAMSLGKPIIVTKEGD